jgi:hypothetical protein
MAMIDFIPCVDATVMKYVVAFLAMPEAMFSSVPWSDIIVANHAFVTVNVRVFLSRHA